MATVTKRVVLGAFVVEFLGVEYPDYFQGYGIGPSLRFTNCTYGIGDTEQEAFDDCLDSMAQSAGFEWSDEIGRRIREAYGDCDGDTTVAEHLGIDEGADVDGDADLAWYHVGIKWNEKSVED